MKKLVYFLLLLCLGQTMVSQKNVSILDATAEKLSAKVYDALKNAKAATDSKIAVLFFTYNNKISDTLKSEMGIEFSKKFEHQLDLFLKNKKAYNVLISNKIAEGESESYFQSPDKVNQKEFWDKFVKSKTPDYFITGSIQTSDNFDELLCLNVKLCSNKYLDQKSISIENIGVKASNTNEQMELIKLTPVFSLDDVANKLSNELKYRTKSKFGNTIFTQTELLYLEYKDTKTASELSNRLNNLLSKKLTDSKCFSLDVSKKRGILDRKSNAKHFIKGNYSDEGNSLVFTIQLIDADRDKIVASAEARIKLEKVNIEYKTNNLAQAEQTNKIIDEKPEPATGGLSIDVWTNKGNVNPVFVENDTLQLFIHTNKECYLRFIYFLADGSAVMLLDNYSVSKEKAGKPFQLPNEFVCSEPFGVETLWVIGSNDKFQNLKTERKYGYDFITDPITEIVKKHRGLQKVEKSEMKFNITTVRR